MTTARKTTKKHKTTFYKLTFSLVELLVHLYHEGVKDAAVQYSGPFPGCCNPHERKVVDILIMVEGHSTCYMVNPENLATRQYLYDIAIAGPIQSATATDHRFGSYIAIRNTVNLVAAAKRMHEKRCERAKAHYALMNADINYEEGDFVRFKDFGNTSESQTPFRPPFLASPMLHNTYPEGSKLIAMGIQGDMARVMVSPPMGDPYISLHNKELLELEESPKKPTKSRSKKTATEVPGLKMTPKPYDPAAASPRHKRMAGNL